MAQTAKLTTLAPRGMSISALLEWAMARFDKINQRRALRRLDDAALSDIGISYRAAMREANKPFFL